MEMQASETSFRTASAGWRPAGTAAQALCGRRGRCFVFRHTLKKLQFPAAPEIPTREAAIRPPGARDCLQFGRRGQILQLIRIPYGGPDSVITYWQNIGAAERKQKEHMSGPQTNSFYLSERSDYLAILHIWEAVKWNNPSSRFLGQIAKVGDLGRRKPRGAQIFFRNPQKRARC